MSKRDVYSKYKDKLRKMKQPAYCFGGKEVEKFYDYAGPRYKRDQLSLFRYDRFRLGYDINLKNIFYLAMVD